MTRSHNRIPPYARSARTDPPLPRSRATHSVHLVGSTAAESTLQPPVPLQLRGYTPLSATMAPQAFNAEAAGHASRPEPNKIPPQATPLVAPTVAMATPLDAAADHCWPEALQPPAFPSCSHTRSLASPDSLHCRRRHCQSAPPALHSPVQP